MGQSSLGYCYSNGLGVDKDDKEAAAWYRKAAEQGHALGQYNLGLCYEYGRGVSPSRSEAIMWYRKAAEQGGEDAKNKLRSLGEKP